VNNVIATVVPVFALIMLGFGAGRFGFFVEGSVRGLSTFVFSFAIPAMLFKAMVTLGIPASPPWALWASFFGSVAIIWVFAILASRMVRDLSGAGGSSAALGATFGNTVMLGLPLGVAHFGPAAVLPMALIISIHLPAQWFAATLLAQWSGKEDGRGLSGIVKTLFRDLFTNPIVLALLAGALWNLSGFSLHPIADKMITLLAQGAIPAALFALGLSLTRFDPKGSGVAAMILMVLKLVVMPLVAAALAIGVFHLPFVEAGIVVLFAALPTGANAYIFAERQGVGEAAVSASVAAGTALSIISLSIVLALLPHT
jgi:predicted permease